MATLAPGRIAASGDDRFFVTSALVMAALVFTAFSVQLGMGRSSFGAPWLVHVHAVVFMGWVVIYVLQTVLAASGRRDLHRTLGWIAVAWVVAMVVLGTAVTVLMVRRGQAPFFFQPAQFVLLNPAAVVTFAGLTWAAVIRRRRTDWHRRLHYCGMANLLGPAFGRLLPMPLLAPWAYESTFVGVLLFPLTAIVLERRRTGRVHRAWWVGTGVIVAATLVVEIVAYGPIGRPLYAAITAGSPGASLDPYGFPPPPSAPLIAGR